jgi:hypothetical protein
MIKIAIFLLLLLSPALGQSVQQSGNVTPGHVTSWITDGVVGDGGPLGGGASYNGMFNAFDFLCSNSLSNAPLIISCGLSATGPNTWNGIQTFAAVTNLSGGATSLTRPAGDSTTNLATTAFVQGAIASVTAPPYNAICDGVTDTTTALQSALNAVGSQGQGGTVLLPSAICYTASGVTVPSNVNLVGRGFFPGNPQFGSQIKCALTTAICVQVGTTGSNGSVKVSDLGVTRAVGTPSSTTIGVLVKDAYNVILTDVGSFNHGICFEAQSDTVFGISLHADFISTGACVDAHWVDNSWPETFLANSRFGMDGLGDYNSNAYIRFTGGSVGPNTFYALGNQFNQGSGLVGTAIDFKSLTTPTSGITSEFSFVGNHFETMNHVVQTDTSATEIQRLKLIGNTVLNTQGSGQEFWNFGAATVIYDLNISGNTLFQNSFTFNPGGQISSAIVSQNQFLFGGMSATFNGTGAGNAISATGNIYNGSVTLSGSWSLAEFSGLLLSGSLTNTTTGAVGVNFPGGAGLASCASTIGFAFGGVSTGITYGTRFCTYQIVGDLVTVQYGIVLTSKGAATGAATLVGLPFTTSATAGIGGGNVVPYAVNFTSLVGFGLSLSPSANTVVANIYTGASTGVVVADNTNFTNTSTIAGTFQYRASP